MTGAERVLERLRQGPATHLELYRLGVIAHSRIAELRKKGHEIACERDGDLYVYRLLSGAGNPDRGHTQPRRVTGEGMAPAHPPGPAEQPSPQSLGAPVVVAPAERLLTSLPPGPTHAHGTPQSVGVSPPAGGQLNLLGENHAVAAVLSTRGNLPRGHHGTGRVRSRTIQARDRDGVGGARHVA